MSDPSPHKPSGFIGSLNCAIEGILWAAKTQRHMLVHLVAAIVALLAALFLRLTLQEFALLALAITLVLFAELVNSAIELIVDLVSPDYHTLARRAKDVAAGAVLVASIGAVVLGYLAVSRLLFGGDTATNQEFMYKTGNLAVLSVVVVVILVVLVKARYDSGTPLFGGMPSGHAATAFSVATSVVFADVGLPIVFLAWGLAGVVAQSRVLLKIHSFSEVVAGSLLGIGVTLLFHLSFYLY